MNRRIREEVEAILRVTFRDVRLLEQAFTHTSYANEQESTSSNERLEFLGDAVLELVVSRWLYEHLEENEGELSRRRAELVCEASLSKITRRLGLERYLRLGRGAVAEHVADNSSAQCDLFESIVGAIDLDQGYEEARAFILRELLNEGDKSGEDTVKAGESGARAPEAAFVDYKSILQEKIQGRGQAAPVYRSEGREGPDHRPVFTESVWWDGERQASGKGSSRKEAQRQAACQALAKLEE